MNSEFNLQDFLNVFNNRKEIIAGTDQTKKDELVTKMTDLYQYCIEHGGSVELLNYINDFYQENIGLINSETIDPKLKGFLQQMDNDYKAVYGEQINKQTENTPLDRTTEVPVNTITNVKQRKLLNNKPTSNHGLSMIAIIFEILTVALIIMMFLSLDI